MALNAIQEALCLHEGLRRLGFKPDELFFGIDGPMIYVAVRTQSKEVTIGCGASPFETQEESVAEWRRLLDWWNSAAGIDEERMLLYDQSYVAANGTRLIMKLLSHGLQIPEARIPQTSSAPPTTLLN